MLKKFKWTQAQKDQGILLIKDYFYEQREETIGDLAALLCLDFICEEFGPYFYNMAISDASAYFHEKADELFVLEVSSKKDEKM